MIQRKRLQDLTIKDNFMFGAVMVDEENCRLFLEMVLDFTIEKVTVSKEKSIIFHPGYKGVRLDIVAKDENHTHYDVEMQVALTPAPGKRSRYYHSQIDMEQLQPGMKYTMLPDAYVIFICDYDPFGKQLYRYTFSSACTEDSSVTFLDGRHTIFLSTCGTNEKEVPKELVTFLKFIHAGLAESTADFDDPYVNRLQKSVSTIKTSRKMEDHFMLWEEFIEETKLEGHAQGLIEGEIKGEIKGVIKGEIIGKQSYILEALSLSGQEIPAELRQKIEDEKDLEVLRIYFRKALTTKSIEEFEEAIQILN